MQITRVDSAEAALAWHAVSTASLEHDHADLPPTPVEEVTAMLGGRDGSGSAVELLLASAEDEPVAAADLTLPVLDNTDLARVSLEVRPDRRGAGIGRAVAARLLELAAQRGRSRVLVHAWEPEGSGSGSTGFARRMGLSPVMASVRRTLDLRTADWARLQALAGADPEGYELVCWRDRVPEADLADAAALLGRMSTDAPQGGTGLQEEAWDGARYRATEDFAEASGLTRLVATARHTATGRLVGYTDLGVYRADAGVATQMDTVVLAEHRGHRVGGWLKAANLLALRRHRPPARAVSTWNATDNPPMAAVNTALGFTVAEHWWEYARTLP